MPGKSIRDNILLVQEILHFMYSLYKGGTIMGLKVDMERAYDCLSWDFVELVLNGIRFHKKFMKWIIGYVQDPPFPILINGSPTKCSPPLWICARSFYYCLYLFILVSEILSKLLKKE